MTLDILVLYFVPLLFLNKFRRVIALGSSERSPAWRVTGTGRLAHQSTRSCRELFHGAHGHVCQGPLTKDVLIQATGHGQRRTRSSPYRGAVCASGSSVGSSPHAGTSPRVLCPQPGAVAGCQASRRTWAGAPSPWASAQLSAVHAVVSGSKFLVR